MQVASCTAKIDSGQAPSAAASGGSSPTGGGGASAPTDVTDCSVPWVQDSPLRRLTRQEYDNTVQDLLGDTTRPAARFVAEAAQLGFTNGAASALLSPAVVEDFENAATALAKTAVTNLPGLLGCDPVALGEDACAKDFISRFGTRAFRRALEPSQLSDYEALYATTKAELGFAKGIELVVRAMLQSPYFLYRLEFGMPAPGAATSLRLVGHETASRLSYLFWGSMPDSALFAAAGQNQLGTKQEILTHATRMLADVKAREQVGLFHRLAFKTGGIQSVTRDPVTFPKWVMGTGTRLAQETRLFLDYATFDGAGTLAELLTAPYTFLNADLAAYYGVSGSFDERFVRVALEPARASGFLTQAGPLALLSSGTLTNPVRRGAFIRGDLLCDAPPAPPADLMVVPPEPLPGQTTRESFAEHSNDPACAGCHRLLDPLGFAFEGFDAAGLPRTTEVGKPIDTTGDLSATDVDGPFQGPGELLTRLAGSQQVAECYVKHWYEFGYGRGITAEDECAITTLASGFQAAGLRVQDLLLALTQIESFSHKAVEP